MEPQAAVVRPGSNLTLPCKIANMGDLSQCRWQKNRFPVGIFSGKYSIPENSKETGIVQGRGDILVVVDMLGSEDKDMFVRGKGGSLF